MFKEIIELGDVFELGSIGGHQSMRILRTYLTTWLDHALYGRDHPLLQRETHRFPEVDFQP